MVSPHLEAEHDRLLQLIQDIRNSGSVAPVNVWISPAPKGEHLYYKLSSKNPEHKNQHLGKAGSEKYRNWRAKIAKGSSCQARAADLLSLVNLSRNHDTASC